MPMLIETLGNECDGPREPRGWPRASALSSAALLTLEFVGEVQAFCLSAAVPGGVLGKVLLVIVPRRNRSRTPGRSAW